MNGAEPKTHWYREPWVWLIIAIPAVAVVFGLYMLQFSIRTFDGLVVDDYYRRGKAINHVLVRDMAAARYGLASEFRFDYRKNTVAMTLSAKSLRVWPAQITLSFLHPTRSGEDRRVELNRTPAGDYFALLPRLHPGRWHVQIESDDWRMVGTLRVPEDAAFTLRSAYTADPEGAG